MSCILNGNRLNLEGCQELRFNKKIYWYNPYFLHLYIQFENYLLQDSDGYDLLDSDNNQLYTTEFESGNLYQSIVCDLIVSDKKGEFQRTTTSTIDGAVFNLPFRNEYIVKIYQNNNLIGISHLDCTKNITDYLISIPNLN